VARSIRSLSVKHVKENKDKIKADLKCFKEKGDTGSALL
jgi:hypothetical protein